MTLQPSGQLAARPARLLPRAARAPWQQLPRPGRRRLAAALAAAACALALAGAVRAQPADVPLVVEIFTLEHRPAVEAVAEVQGLLTPRGTVELQPSENTLVIRDTSVAVRVAIARLRQFDQPPRRVRLEVQVVRAGVPPEAPTSPRLAPELARRLRELLRFEQFRLLARAGLEMSEGEPVAYEFGGEYEVSFAPGPLAPTSLRLRDFILARGAGEGATPLIHTNLNLMVDRPMVLGLAQTESSDTALMVVLSYRLVEEGAR